VEHCVVVPYLPLLAFWGGGVAGLLVALALLGFPGVPPGIKKPGALAGLTLTLLA
jgi:hypothetical protein